MKVIAINGSPNKNGNTYHSLKIVTEQLNKQGIETEIVQIGNKVIRGCMHCNKCAANQDQKCAMTSDIVNEYLEKMIDADGIILGSPVHFSGVGGTMKSFLDRVFYVAAVNPSLFQHKVGASVVAVRRSGGIPTMEQLNNFLNYSEMLIATSNYWTVAHGWTPGEVNQDEEGVQIMQVLGRNMAYLLRLKENGEHIVERPSKTKKILTNFIR